MEPCTKHDLPSCTSSDPLSSGTLPGLPPTLVSSSLDPLHTEREPGCSYPNTQCPRPPKCPAPLQDTGQHPRPCGAWLPAHFRAQRMADLELKAARLHPPNQQPCQAATVTLGYKPLGTHSLPLLRQIHLMSQFHHPAPPWRVGRGQSEHT